ncbi:MFS general substrate transporter [Xylaria intraflava]|nr:MFS general substrate transporter [Xylaria intraflava]
MVLEQLPSSQRAVQQGHDGQARLVDDAAIPPLLPGYVLVKTSAVSLNPSDHKIMKNYPVEGAYVGTDFSGTIVQAADDVDASIMGPGTVVCGSAFGFASEHRQANGAFSEYVRARADLLLRINPSSDSRGGSAMPLLEAATLGIAISTCILALWDPDALGLPGTPEAPDVSEKPVPVLIYGGSTATGTIAAQLLRHSGYDPIATCSPRNFDMVRERGVSAVFDYSDPDVAAKIKTHTGGRLKYVLDCISDADSVAVCYGAIQRPGGRYASLELVPSDWLAKRRAVRAAFVLAAEAYGEEIRLGSSSGDRENSCPDTQVAAILVEPNGVAQPAPFKPGFRVYAIVVGLGITNLLAALENTVISVAAPVLLTDLNLGANFVWVTNAFFLASTAILPLFGQFCNVFGRRYVMLAVIAIFVLGSGICGGANNGAMLIGGRAVQGIGSGGIIMVSSIVISDLVPLRQRGNMSAILISIFGVGSALGPFIGGAIVASTTWRWVFYLNLPIGGVAFAVLFIFLRVNYNKEMSFWQKLKRVDIISNVVLVASTVAILYALSYAGTLYAWQSWHTLVPLLLGFFGLFLFTWLQKLSLSAEPLIPLRFFRAPTSMILSVCTFVYAALLYWCIFFLPIFFQAVLLYSPTISGVALLPISLLGIPGSIIGAIALTRWGRYKPIHIAAFAIQLIGLGLFTMQNERTTIAEWVIFQAIFAIGLGMVFSTLLPAFQAFIHERDLASCTAAWYFVRLFGHVWGVAIPAAVFNNRVDVALAQGAISDPAVAQRLAGGAAYQSASAAFVRAVYAAATQRVFQVAIAFAGVAFLLSLFEKEIELRKTLDTEFGLENKEGEGGPEAGPGPKTRV